MVVEITTQTTTPGIWIDHAIVMRRARRLDWLDGVLVGRELRRRLREWAEASITGTRCERGASPWRVGSARADTDGARGPGRPVLGHGWRPEG